MDQLVRAPRMARDGERVDNGTDAHMRNRTFLGLIFLVVALLVASTPQLLQPTARGVERLGVKAGVMSDAAKAATRDTRTGKGGNALESQMTLKGYAVDASGGMQDLSPVGERINQRNRLAAGEGRSRVPGSRSGRDPYNPPVQAEDGLLLDINACPVFPADADIAAIVADPDLRQRYADKAASANDPAACRTAIDAQVSAAVSTVGPALPGDRRQLSASVRSDSQRLMFDLYANGMYEDLFAGWLDAPKTAGDIRQSLADAS